MKPKSKKEAYLFEKFSDPTEGDFLMTDREQRQLRKMWKRKRSKMFRKNKNYLNDCL